jgi:hypothetical protein
MTDLAAAVTAPPAPAPAPDPTPMPRHRRASRRSDPPHLLVTVVCGVLALGAVLPTGIGQGGSWQATPARLSATAAPHSPPAPALLDVVPAGDAPEAVALPFGLELPDLARSGDRPPPAALPFGLDAERRTQNEAKTEAKAEDATPPAAPTYLGGVPEGVGMWTWEVEETEGGDAEAIVAKAAEIGLTHLYARTGSSWQGLHGTAFLDDLLPVAHAAGIAVYGWDFPNFADVDDDIARAVAAIEHRTPDGHRIDGFVADIETQAEGTRLTADAAQAYSEGLRAAVGDDEVLIACVPNPTNHFRAIFPYDRVLPSYDAVAPMVYWLNRQPDDDAARAMAFFEPYGLPIVPVGQAYEGALEGGRPGPPTPDELHRFARTASDAGAQGMSFWSWQHAAPSTWDAISQLAAG